MLLKIFGVEVTAPGRCFKLSGNYYLSLPFFLCANAKFYRGPSRFADDARIVFSPDAFASGFR